MASGANIRIPCRSCMCDIGGFNMALIIFRARKARGVLGGLPGFLYMGQAFARFRFALALRNSAT